tara:strand:+ start:25 stop:2538 length:2514 start_codon:yes stop_codon:yes gene_type:complete
MVKFGVKLANNRIEQWEAHYIDYDGLKKLMKKMKKKLAKLNQQKASSSSAAAGGGYGDDGGDAQQPEYGSIEEEDPRAPFAAACRAELRKVEAFYAEMCTEFAQRLEHLAKFFEADGASGAERAAAATFDAVESDEKDAAATFDAADSDDEEEAAALFGDASSRTAVGKVSEIKLACRTLFREMNFLSNFAIVNYTGFVKIIKKYRKAVQQSALEVSKSIGPGSSIRSATDRRESSGLTPSMAQSGVVRFEESLFHASALGPSLTVTLRRELSQSPIVRCEELHQGLLPMLGEKYARAYTDDDVGLAKSELLMKVREQSNWGLFHNGLRLGALLLLLCWVVWDFATHTALLEHPALAAFRFVGYIVLLIFGWSLCLYTWSEYRINWTYLFERNADAAYTFDRVFDIGTTLALITAIFLLVFVKVGLGQLPALIPLGWIPLPLLVLVALLGVWHRPPIVMQLIGVVFAPFVKVTFAGVFAGNVLTSLVRPLQDGATTVCYIATGAFNVGQGHRFFERERGFEHALRIANKRIEPCVSSWIFLDVVVPVLSCLPLWLSCMQNLRRYIDTRNRFPHLLNAFKYGFAHSVVIFGTLHPQLHLLGDADEDASTTSVRKTWRVLFVISLVLSTLSTFLWDVTRDWGLCRVRALCPDDASTKCKDVGLRSRLMYRRQWLYRIAIVFDFFLRFVWTLTLVPAQNTLVDFRFIWHWLWHRATGEHWPEKAHGAWTSRSVAPLLVAPFLGVSEVFRRWMWALIRVENEQLNNASGFRRVKWVPMVFDTPLHKDDPARQPLRTMLRLAFEVIVLLVLFLAVVGVAIDSALPHHLLGDSNGTFVAHTVH